MSKLTLMGVGGPASSAPFSPSDIAGLQIWVKADQITGLADGDSVSTWSDQSGNAHDLTNAGAVRPIYKTAIQNGLPIVRFNGTSQYLTNSSFGFSTSAFTAFFASSITATNFPAFLAENNGATGGFVALGGDSGGKMAISKTGIATSSSNLTATGFSDYEYKSAGISAGDITVTVYKDGTQGAADLTLTSLSSNTVITVGASKTGVTDFLPGDMGEFILYNSQLSDTDRGKVESYLKTKWGF